MSIVLQEENFGDEYIENSQYVDVGELCCRSRFVA